MMFQIKICGITTPDDAAVVARAGADAVGLNFYARSPRFLQSEQARRIVEAVPRGIIKVGLFVNASRDDVCRTFDDLHLELVQLHGDEPPEFLAQLGGRPVMRAFRVGEAGLSPVVAYLERCRHFGRLPRLVLIDSLASGSYGGTGKVVNWEIIRSFPRPDWFPPIVLAGGLAPENVGDAIRSVAPAAVDVASGVESSPGRKCPELVRRFVQAAREAFSLL
jgi:phosphoribosylanthranilate isomerase